MPCLIDFSNYYTFYHFWRCFLILLIVFSIFLLARVYGLMRACGSEPSWTSYSLFRIWNRSLSLNFEMHTPPTHRVDLACCGIVLWSSAARLFSRPGIFCYAAEYCFALLAAQVASSLSLPLSLSFGNPSSTKSCGGSESTAGGLPCSRAAAGAMQTKTAVRSAALTCAELAWWSPKLLTNSSSSPKMTNWRFDSSIVVEIVDKYLI